MSNYSALLEPPMPRPDWPTRPRSPSGAPLYAFRRNSQDRVARNVSGTIDRKSAQVVRRRCVNDHVGVAQRFVLTVGRAQALAQRQSLEKSSILMMLVDRARHIVFVCPK